MIQTNYPKCLGSQYTVLLVLCVRVQCQTDCMYMYHASDIAHNSTKCRICSSVVERLHCVSLFSPEMTKCNRAFRMSRLLEVPKISQEDPLPHYACRSCKVKFIPWNLSWKVCALLQSQAISHWPLPAQSSSLQLIRNVLMGQTFFFLEDQGQSKCMRECCVLIRV